MNEPKQLQQAGLNYIDSANEPSTGAIVNSETSLAVAKGMLLRPVPAAAPHHVRRYDLGGGPRSLDQRALVGARQEAWRAEVSFNAPHPLPFRIAV